jgi:hypothetical protein
MDIMHDCDYTAVVCTSTAITATARRADTLSTVTSEFVETKEAQKWL